MNFRSSLKKSTPLIQLTLTILLTIIFLTGSSSASEADLSLIKEIIEANTGIKTIEAEIIQNINTPENSAETFIGKYFADNNGRFRIDYTVPSRQTVLNNGLGIYWYYNDDNILYIIRNGTAGQNEPRMNPLQELQTKEFNSRFKVNYKGKRLYGFFKFAYRFMIKDIKNKLNFEIQADTKNKVLLSKIITDNAGVEIIKEIYGDYEKIQNVYVPKRIDVYGRTGRGIIRNTTRYRNIRANYIMPDNLFLIKFPDNAEKKYLNN